MARLGGIEAGGSKFVCAAGSGPDDAEFAEFPTTTPEETVGRVIGFFRSAPPVTAVGIASFGPIDPNPRSPTYGYITSTPKQAWRNFDFAGVGTPLAQPAGGLRYRCECGGAGRVALGSWPRAAQLHLRYRGHRHRWGSVHRRSFAARTVAPRDGPSARPARPSARPISRQLSVSWRLSGGAGRWSGYPGPLGKTRPHASGRARSVGLRSHYLALGIMSWTCTLSPERIVLGGGVMQRQELFPLIRGRVTELLNGYLDTPRIVAPELGRRGGARCDSTGGSPSYYSLPRRQDFRRLEHSSRPGSAYFVTWRLDGSLPVTRVTDFWTSDGPKFVELDQLPEASPPDRDGWSGTTWLV